MEQKHHGDNSMRVVNFYGDALTIVFLDEIGKIGVLLVDICKSLNIDYPNQFKKVMGDTNNRFQKCLVEVGGRNVLAIPISKVNAFLFSINPLRVKGYVYRNGEKIRKRDILIRYQDECVAALSMSGLADMSLGRLFGLTAIPDQGQGSSTL